MNEVILLGNISQPPTMRTGTDGKSRCHFSVALNKKHKDGSVKTTFVSCIANENISQFIERYFRLGDCIALHGELNIKSYKTTHGDKATKSFVAVDRVSFCGKGYDDVKTPKEPEDTEESIINLPGEDDLPF